MGKVVDTGKMPEKIVAAAQYHIDLLTELHNKRNTDSLIRSALQVVGKNFNLYMDNLARRDHMSFHHIYETGETGNENARLFKFTINENTISYSFTEAKRPEKSGDVFKRKAFVVENGESVFITPKKSRFLSFVVDGEPTFAQKVFIPNPGGAQAVGQFQQAFEAYMQNNANQALIDIGFYDKIISEISNQSDSAMASIEKGNLNASGMAKASASAIVRKVSR